MPRSGLDELQQKLVLRLRRGSGVFLTLESFRLRKEFPSSISLAGGGFALRTYARHRSNSGSDPPPVALTEDEKARLAALISAEAPAEKS